MHRRQPRFRTAAQGYSSRRRGERRWRLSPLARALAAIGLLASPLWLQAAPPAANALPTGLQIGVGQAAVQVQGNQMTVRNSAGAILNWNSFNIGSAAGVHFDQANAASKVLNRVTGSDPSQIFGSLSSNGQVWLLNPNGVLFGQGARVDVAGLVASTLRLNDNDFLAGRYRFLGDAGSTAGVRNEGSIRSAHGGQVVMLGSRVENTGSVQTDGGNTTLASASSVELVDTGLPNLAVRVEVASGEAVNLGLLQAHGGTIDVFGAIVNQQGVVRADTLVADAQGHITLKASGTLTLGTGSVTAASGSAAGTQGGRVDLLGDKVAIEGTAAVDASGDAGGGRIRAGGGAQGQDSSVSHASTVTVDADSSLRADAQRQGNGGQVIVWADDSARVHGSLSARGGVAGGDGGFVETSALRLLEVTRAADASAPLGLAGLWLLDPSDITVVHGSAGTLTGGSFDPPAVSTIGDTQINTALNAGTNVSLLTSAGSGGTGAVTFRGNADVGGAVVIANTGGGARTFTVTTSGAITINAGASLAGSAGNSLSVALSGSSVAINGTIDNRGGTTTVNSATTLGGTLRNGSFVSTAATPTLGSTGTGTFDGITLASNLQVAGSYIINNGLTLANGVTVTKDAGAWYFAPNTTLAAASGGSATLQLNGAQVFGAYGGTGSLTLGTGLTVRGHGSINNWSAATLVNNGTLSASTAGQTLAVNTTNFTNNTGGTVAADGGTMAVSPTNWSSSGRLALNAGMLTLDGNYNTASISGLSRGPDTTLRLSGLLDNTGATLDLGAASLFNSNGGTSLYNGTIRNGTISNSVPGTTLISANGTLSGVTIGSNLSVSGQLFLNGGLTLGNGVTVTKDSGNWYFSPSTTLGAAAGGSATLQMNGGVLYGAYGGTGSLTIGSGLTVRGYGSVNDWSSATLINNGTLSASVAGQALSINTAAFTNNTGATVAADGGTMNVHATNWSSTGALAVNAGSMSLSGTYTVASLGSNLTRNAGTTLVLAGTLDNTGATLDLGTSPLFNSNGSTTLSGTIRNGTLSNSVPGTVLVSSNGTLNGVTLADNVSISGTLFVSGGLTLANGVTVTKDSSTWYVSPNTTLGVASGGNATLQLNGGILYGAYGGNGSLTIGSGLTVRGYGSINNYSTVSLVNNGTLSANAPGQTLAINTTAFTNSAGAVAAANGGTMDIGATGWSSNGTLALNAGTLSLSGNYTIASIGSNLTRSAGTSLVIGGTLDNTGGTLDLGSSALFGAGGGTTLSGTIRGGTLSNSVPGTLLFSSNGTLNGVTLADNLSVSGALFVSGGLTLANGVTLTKDSSSWYFSPNTTLGVATGGSATLQMNGGILYGAYGGNGSLTLGSGLTVRGYGSFNNYSTASLVNNGTLSANAPGQALAINTTGFTNSAGAVAAANGGTMDIGATSWASNGTLALNAGTMSLSGTYTIASIGSNLTRSAGTTLLLGGTLDNTGGTMDLGSSALFGGGGTTTLSGTIRNGTLSNSVPGTLLLSSNGTLDGVTLANNLSVSGALFVSNGLTLANGVTLTKDSSSWYFAPNSTLGAATGGTASLQANGGILYGAYGGNGSLTLGSGLTVRGYGSINNWSTATLVNNGTLSANAAGQTFTINTTTFTNNAGAVVAANGGTVNVSATNWSNSGTLALNGGAMRLGGTYTAASLGSNLTRNSGTTLTLEGTLDNTGGTTNLGGSALFGANGTTTLSGVIRGGTLSNSVPGTVLVSSSGTLDGVTVADNLSVSGQLFVSGGLTLANGVTLTKDSSAWYFSPNTTLGAATGGNAILHSNGGLLYGAYGSNGSLTIGSGLTVRGYGTFNNWSTATLVNSGTLSATVPGQTLSVNTTTFTNNAGGVVAANGGVMDVSPTNWTSAGSLALNTGTLSLGGSYASSAFLTNFSRGAGTTLTLGGTIDHTGRTLDVASAAYFGNSGNTTLSSATLRNGTLTSSVAGTVLGSAGTSTLDGITVGSDLNTTGNFVVSNGLALANGVTLTKDNATWSFAPNQAITVSGGTGSATFNANGGTLIGASGGAGSLTIGTGITVQGITALTQSSALALVNNGTLSFSGSINASTFSNAGTLEGAGTVTVATLNNSGTLAPGLARADTTGTLAISGALTMAAGSQINLDVNGRLAGDFDRVTVSGVANITGSTLNVAGTGGAGSLNVLNAGTLAGTFGTVNAGTFTLTPAYTATALTLSIAGNNNAGFNWVGGGAAGNWNDPLNWSTGAVPTAANTVYVGSGAGTITLSGAPASVGGLTSDAILTVPANSTLQVAGNTVLRGTVTLNGGTITGAGALTVGTGGTFNWSSGTLDATAASTLTTQFGSATTISGGTLGANRSWTNFGSVNISQAGTFTRNGSLNLAGGSLSLGGTYTAAALSNLTRGAGSSLTLAGVLNNTGNTIDLSDSTLFGASGGTTFTGTLRGGTVVASVAGTTVDFSSGTVDGVTIGGNLRVAGNLNVTTGLTLANGTTLTRSGGNTNFAPNLSIATTGGGSATIVSNGSGFTAAVGGVGTLTLGTGVTLRGYGTINQSSAGTFVNNGTLSADVGGQTLTVSTGTFTNAAGGVAAANGGTMNIQAPNWSNAGSLAVNAGAMTLSGNYASSAIASSVTRSAGTSLTLGGTITNTGSTLDVGGIALFGASGSTTLTGRLVGGTLIDSSAGIVLTGGGTLDNVTIGSNLFTAGTFSVANGLTLANGVNLRKDGSNWNFAFNQTIGTTAGGAATLSTNGGALIAASGGAGTLTIGTGITVQGYGALGQSSAATITNNGTLSASVLGQTFSVSAATFTNGSGGVVAANGGDFDITSSNWSNSGTLAVNSGSMTLAGGYNSTSIASGVTRGAGSTLVIAGTMTNTGNTLDLGSAGLFGASGSTVLSGTIVGGTLTNSSPGARVLSASNVLNGVTIGSSMAWAGSTEFTGGLTLSNGVALDKDSATWYFAPNTAITTSAGGSASLSNAGAQLIAAYRGAGSLTIGTGVTLRGYGSILNSSAANLIVDGTLNASASGQTYSVSTSNLTNNAGGVLSATGGTLNIASANWTSAGSLALTAGAVSLSGNYSSAALSSGFTRSAGTSLQLGGTIDNTGRTLDVGTTALFAANGTTVLTGTLRGGNVSSSASGVTLNASSNPTLDGVTFASSMGLNGSYFLTNGLTLNNGVTLTRDGGTWYLLPNQTFSTPVGGTATILNNGGILYAAYGGAGTLTFGAGISLLGYTALLQSSAATVVNNGTINSSAGGQTFTLAVNSFTNGSTGVVAASGGTLNLSSTNWVNSGTLAVNSGTMNLSGAYNSSSIASGLTRGVGSSLGLGGTIDNTGQTLDLGSNALFGANGSTVLTGNLIGGSLVSGQPGTVLRSNGGLLNGVTLGNGLTVAGATTFANGVTLADGATVTKDSASWTFGPNQTIGTTTGGSATLVNLGGSLVAASGGAGNLTLGTGVTLRGYGSIFQSSAATFVNNGTLDLTAIGQSLNIATAGFTQSGTVQIAAGASLIRSAGFTNNGTIAGLGTIQVGTGAARFVNQGTLSPGVGATRGTLTVQGDMQFGAGSVLALDLGSNVTGNSDRLDVSGVVTANAGAYGGLTLTRSGLTGPVLLAGDSYRIVTAASGLNSGTFSAPTLARTTQLTPSYTGASVDLLVVPAVLTVAGDAATKVYGTADPGFSYTVSGLLGNDTQGAAITGQLGRTAGSNVGGYAYAPGTLYSPLGYAVSVTPAPNFTITPAPLTVTANDFAKGFDGLAYSGGNGVSFSGLVNGDTAAAVTGTPSYGGSSQGAINAGSYSIVPSGLSAANYTLTYAPGTLVISQAALSIVSLAGTRVYDGTAVVDAAVFTLSGLRGSDDLRLLGAGTLDNANVGTNLPVGLGSLALANGTVGLATNYTLAGGTRTVTITPASLNVTGLGVGSRVYDSTRTATLTGTASVVALGADLVTVGGTPVALFGDKNVGTAKPVTVSGFTLSGRDAGNYTVVQPTGLAADITPLSVSLSGTVVANKVYDGNTVASLSNAGSVAALPGDTVGVGGNVQANFSDRNVGTGKAVTLSGFALTGADAGNYTLVGAPTALTADITPLALAIGGLAAQSRVYDTTTAVTLTGSGSVSGIGADVVTLTGTPSAVFGDKNVGNNKPVTLSGLSLTGADAGNYTLTPGGGLTANITPAQAALSGLAANSRVYNTSTAATFQGTASVGRLGNDDLSLAGAATGAFADKNVGTGKAVTLTGLSLAGADAGNYVLVTPAYTADITAAALSLQSVAAADRGYDTTRNAALSGTLAGRLGNDTVTLNLTGQFNDANVGNQKPVAWNASIGGTDAANYSLSTTSGTSQASITPALLTYNAARAVGTAGQALPTLSGTVSGFLGSETLASATTGTLAWTSTATTASTAGNYAVAGSGLSALNYSFAQATGNATALLLQPAATADAATITTNIVITAALASVQVPVTMSTPVSGRVLDVTTAFTPPGSAVVPAAASTAAAATTPAAAAAGAAPDSRSIMLLASREVAEGVAFRPLDLSKLPRDEVQSLLAARARYKQQVFSKSVYRLQQDPTLADVRVCRNEAELETGICIVSDQLKREIEATKAAMNKPTARERSRRAVKTAALPVIERKLALVIGINKYSDKQIPELSGSVPDARAVQQLLETRMGYETTVLENPSREAMVKAFNKLALEAEGNDSVIIYYAGHGVLVPINGVETGFWLPSDVDAETPSTWLSNADIGRMVAAVGARQVMLVSDSCYSGNLVGGDRVRLNTTDDASEMLKRRAAVVMSSGGDEPVADTGREGHSVFAWHFMRALESLSEWQAGGSLYDRVRAGVIKDFPQTPQYGASRSAGHQGNTDYLFERRELEAAKP